MAVLLLMLSCAASPMAAWAIDIDFQVPETVEKKKQVKTSVDDVFVDLDMSSPREVVPGALAFIAEKFKKPSVTLSEGDSLRTVSQHCMLTAAEYFAARQLMRDGSQKLALRENGTAGGGSANLDKYTIEHCRNLYLPRRIRLQHEAGSAPKAAITGELHIAGTLEVDGGGETSLRAKRIRLYPAGVIEANQAAISLVADKIDGGVSADEASDRKVLDATASGAKSEYTLKRSEETLVKANDEFIPTEGTDDSVEVNLLLQQRESCQLSTPEEQK